MCKIKVTSSASVRIVYSLSISFTNIGDIKKSASGLRFIDYIKASEKGATQEKLLVILEKLDLFRKDS